MPADTYDPIIGFILQGDGNNNNSWGDTCNNSAIKPIAQAIAGVNTITAVGGTVDLSTVVPPTALRLDAAAIQIANGALTSDLIVKVTNVSKTWWFKNATSGAFQMFVQVPGGVSPNGLVQIPQGLNVFVMCDGSGNLHRHDRAIVGSFSISGKAAAGAGEILCNGASILRAEFPDLFNAIGTTWGSVDGTHFTVPQLTDTNRFLRAGGGSGPAVGTYQANQNLSHTHTGSGTTGNESVDHTHNFSGSTGTMSANDPHSHVENIPAAGGGSTWNNCNGAANTGVTFSGPSTNATSINHTHTFSGTTSGVSAGHTHTFSFTTSGGSADGAEARPESAAVLICIRY